MKEHEKVLVEILGKDAFFSTDFNVTKEVRTLVFTVKYLFTQLGLIQKMLPEDDKDYVSDVEVTAIQILKGEKR